MDNNASYTWKSMLRARSWCKGLIERNIVNGEHTNTWFDPWLNGSSLVENYGWNFMAVYGGCNRKVCTLISGNKWKDHLEHIPTQIRNIVHNIKIHNHRQKDFWVWSLNNNGMFSMMSAWKHIRSIHKEYK